VIFIGAATSTFDNLHSHGSGDDVSGGKILSGRSVSFHESLTEGVSEDTTFTSATFGHEATSTVDTSGMELDEFEILKGETSSSDHSTTITSTSMGGCAREVCSTVTTSGQNSLLSSHSVESTISKIVGHDTSAFTIVHDQIKSEVFNEEGTVVTERSTEKSVKHGVTSTIGSSAASVGL